MLEIVVLSFLFLCGLVAFGIWLSGLKEERRVARLIRDTHPVYKDFPNGFEDQQKVTRAEGFRARLRQIKTTLAGVGRVGNG